MVPADKADPELRVRRLLAAEAEIIALVIRHRRALGQAELKESRAAQ
jgi:hypothetical protein